MFVNDDVRVIHDSVDDGGEDLDAPLTAAEQGLDSVGGRLFFFSNFDSNHYCVCFYFIILLRIFFTRYAR